MASYFQTDEDDLLLENEAFDGCFSRPTEKRKSEMSDPIQVPNRKQLKELRSSNMKLFFPVDDEAIKDLADTIIKDYQNFSRTNCFLKRTEKTIDALMHKKKNQKATIFQEIASSLKKLALHELLKECKSLQTNSFHSPLDDEAIKDLADTIIKDYQNFYRTISFLKRAEKTIDSFMQKKKYLQATIFQEIASSLKKLDLPELLKECKSLQMNSFQKHLIENKNEQESLIEETLSETFLQVCKQIESAKSNHAEIAETYLRNGDVGVCIRIMIRMFSKFDSSSMTSFIKQRSFKSNASKLFDDEDFFFIVDEEEFKRAKELLYRDRNELKKNRFGHCYVSSQKSFSLEKLELSRFADLLIDPRLNDMQAKLTPEQKNAKIKDENAIKTQIRQKLVGVPTKANDVRTRLKEEYQNANNIIQNKYKLVLNDLKEKKQFILSKRISSKTKLENIPHQQTTAKKRKIIEMSIDKSVLPFKYCDKEMIDLREVFMKCKWFNVPGAVIIDVWIDPKSSNAMNLVDTFTRRKIISSLVNVPNPPTPKEATVFRPNDEFIRIIFHRLKHQVNINTYIGDERRAQYWVQMYYHVSMGNEEFYFIQDEYMFSRLKDFLTRQSFRRTRCFDFNFSMMSKGTKRIWIQSDHPECMSTSCSKLFGDDLFFEPTDFFFFLITNASQREQKQDLFIINFENKTYTFKIIYEKNNNEFVFQNEFVFEEQKNQLENHIKMTKHKHPPNEESKNVALFMVKSELSNFRNIPTSEISKTSEAIVKTLMENSKDNRDFAQNIASVLCYFPFGRKIGSHFGLNQNVFFDLPIVSPDEFINGFEALSKENKINVSEMIQFERLSLVGQFFEFLHDASALTLRKKGRVKIVNKMKPLQSLCSNRDDPVIVVPHVFYADNGHVYALELFQLISRFTQGDIVNPYTGEEFNPDFVQKINNQFPDFDEDVVQKFDVLQNLSDDLPLRQIKDNSAPLQKLLDDYLLELNTVKELKETFETFQSNLICSTCKRPLTSRSIASAKEFDKLQFCGFDCIENYNWPE